MTRKYKEPVPVNQTMGKAWVAAVLGVLAPLILRYLNGDPLPEDYSIAVTELARLALECLFFGTAGLLSVYRKTNYVIPTKTKET